MMSNSMPSTVTPGPNANATPVEMALADSACCTIVSSTKISDTLSMLPKRASTSQLYAASSAEIPSERTDCSMILGPPGWIAQRSISDICNPLSHNISVTTGATPLKM